MRPIVLDPGHGGLATMGRSTPLGLRAPGGTFEKDVVLDVALRVANALRARGHAVALTRDRDENLSLGARQALARDLGARAFVSLHLHERAGLGSAAWTHAAAAPDARRLAVSLGGGRAQAGPLATLDPGALGMPAALVELGALATAADEARWAAGDERALRAEALAETLDAWGRGDAGPGRSIDLWNEVPLVPQVTGMSCWAAAAAMVVGWRDSAPADPEDIARGAGRWREYRAGLLPSDTDALAAAWRLQTAHVRNLDVGTLEGLLRAHGPVWLGEADPGLHVVVITGMVGDGSAAGTFVRVNDPWPEQRGERYSIPFARLAANFRAVERLAGFPARVLHADARPS